jgi:hypothetical protein
MNAATPGIGDANHTNRCALVVGGYYNASTTLSYYRIDFNDNGTPRNLINVMRNHHYRVNITAVTGPGFSTPDDAYNTFILNSNMNVVITNWEELSSDIIFDGENWVSVRKKHITLPGNSDISGYLQVGSNLDASTWELSLDGTTFSTTASIQNTNFVVTKPASGTDGVLKITTRNQITDGTNRTATLTLKIGRLKFNIAITQIPDFPLDWEEGPEFPTDF